MSILVGLHSGVFHLIFLTSASILAGIIDTLAGGGGLITVPALLFTGIPPVLALGTNKFQSCLCETSATFVFHKKIKISFGSLKAGLFFTLLGSILGTLLLQQTQIENLKRIVPLFLLGVFLLQLFTKAIEGGDVQSPLDGTNLSKRLVPMGLGIGFYNGYFGPGTGTLWAVSLMRFARQSLRNATVLTKPLNLTGNLTALTIFFIGKKVDFFTGSVMGIGAILGGVIGAQLVIFKDARWLKVVFNSMMAISVASAFYKQYF